MRRNAFTVMTSESLGRALETATAVLGEAGYGAPTEQKGESVFSPKGEQIAGRESFPHTLRLRGREATRGCTVFGQFEGPVRVPIERATALAMALRDGLSARLPEGVPLYEGKVSADARRVDFAGPRPEWEMGPLTNRIQENSKWLQGLFLGFGLFFGGIGVVAIATGLLGWTGDRTAVFGGIVFIAMATVLGFVPTLILWRTAGYPNAALISFEGIRLEYRHRKAVDVPWANFEEVSTQVAVGGPALGAEVPTIGVYRDAKGKRRKAHLSRLIADEVRESQAAMEDLKPLLARPHAAAVLYAAAGTHVFVADRILTREELKHQSLNRRYLERGRILPVYLPADEDRRLLLEFAGRHRLKAADLRFLSQVAMARESWGTAAELLRAALEADPEDDEAAYLAGGALLKDGRREEGERLLDAFLERRGRSPRAHVMRAILAMDAKVEPDALRHLTRAAELDPNHLEAFEVWFDVVAALEGPEVAVAELEEAARLRPQAWAPRLALGGRLHRMGKSEQSLPLLEAAWAIQSTDETLSALAKAYMVAGNGDRAVAMLEAEKAKGSIGPWATLILAQAYMARGQRGRARSTLNAVPMGDNLNIYGAWRALRAELARG